MDKDEVDEENAFNIKNQEAKNVDDNDVEVIPYFGAVEASLVAVTYGPSPLIHVIMDSSDDAVFENPDILIEVDVNADMYGGPWPEYFQQEETDINDIIDLGTEIEHLFVDDTDSEDAQKNKDSFGCDDFLG